MFLRVSTVWSLFRFLKMFEKKPEWRNHKKKTFLPFVIVVTQISKTIVNWRKFCETFLAAVLQETPLCSEKEISVIGVRFQARLFLLRYCFDATLEFVCSVTFKCFLEKIFSRYSTRRSGNNAMDSKNDDLTEKQTCS